MTLCFPVPCRLSLRNGLFLPSGGHFEVKRGLFHLPAALFGLPRPAPFRPGCSMDAAGCPLPRPGCSMDGAGCSLRRAGTTHRPAGCSMDAAGCPHPRPGCSRNRPGCCPISRREHPASGREDPDARREHPETGGSVQGGPVEPRREFCQKPRVATSPGSPFDPSPGASRWRSAASCAACSLRVDQGRSAARVRRGCLLRAASSRRLCA